jgi:hypothetical protein
VRVDTSAISPDEAVDAIVAALVDHGILPAGNP